MSYFHTTPQGRIINRLTKDTADVDKNLADFSAFYIRSFLQLLSTVVVIGATVPFALPAIVPILLLFYFLYQYFQARRPGQARTRGRPCGSGLRTSLMWPAEGPDGWGPAALRQPCTARGLGRQQKLPQRPPAHMPRPAVSARSTRPCQAAHARCALLGWSLAACADAGRSAGIGAGGQALGQHLALAGVQQHRGGPEWAAHHPRLPRRGAPAAEQCRADGRLRGHEPGQHEPEQVHAAAVLSRPPPAPVLGDRCLHRAHTLASRRGRPHDHAAPGALCLLGCLRFWMTRVLSSGDLPGPERAAGCR